MREFKIGYTSDEHLDFHIGRPTGNLEKDERRVRSFITQILKPDKCDIFISAGDQGHYNSDIMLYLKIMTEYANDVFFLGGNHSMYLVNSSQKNKYDLNSYNRLKEIEDWSLNEKNIHYLDGNYISIDGLKIGGLMNWYNLPTNGLISQWNEVMNDSNLIYEGSEHNYIRYGYGAVDKISNWDTQKYRKYQEDSWNKLKDKCDIIVTHILPCYPPEYIVTSEHAGQNDIFYMTDDIKRVKDTGCSIVIYGHDHTSKEWRYEDIYWKTNSIGYPSEYIGNNIKYFNYKEEK